MNYCTVNDVVSVATDFRSDLQGFSEPSGSVFQPNTNSIAESEIDSIIEEATEATKMILSPRYDLTVIEALSPLPTIVVSYAKTYAAILLYERYKRGTEPTKEKVSILAKRMQDNEDVIVLGSLRDTTGDLIQTLADTYLAEGKENDNFTADSDLYDLYNDTPESGERKY